jgi:hypothetical protein
LTSFPFPQYIVRLCILKYDNKKGTAEATLPLPEPSDIDHCCNIDFEKERTEWKNLKSRLKLIQ